MMHELLLLRHGKAVQEDPEGDFQRVLRDKGKRAAQRMGVWLASQQLLPDRVLSSSAVRAANTAEKCCKAMGIPADRIVTSDTLYLASPQLLLEQIRQTHTSIRRLLIVGHNPGLEDLLQQLCPDLPPQTGVMATATLARIALRGPWHALQAGTGRLVALQRAKDLPKQFPWPDALGTQMRDRPAYYYQQSAVIPFRFHNGRMLILAIKSSSHRHWVVPKGVVEPGLSGQESALKEAYEEAGVEGSIVGPALGRYRYPKWGAECVVEVFPMWVQRELPINQWPEHHRGRRWVDASDARVILNQREVVPMVDQLTQLYRE